MSEWGGGDRRDGALWRRIWRLIGENQFIAAVAAGLMLALIFAGLSLVPNLFGPADKPASVAAEEIPTGGWGPTRRMYRCDESGGCVGARYITFNSTVGSPVGSEPAFLSAKIEGDVGGVRDVLAVEPGDVVVLRIFFANNGDPNRTARSLVARGLTGRVELPRDPARTTQVVAWISADNANPTSVYDSLNLSSDSLFSGGTALGFRRLDGHLDSCYCHSGYVVAKVVVGGAY